MEKLTLKIHGDSKLQILVHTLPLLSKKKILVHPTEN